MKKLDIQRGSTLEFAGVIKDSKGDRVDITGWKQTFMVKKSVDDDDAAALLSSIITSYDDPQTGETVFVVDAETTAQLPIGVYVWGIQLIDNDGNVGESQPQVCEVSADVVRATS